MAKPLNLEDFVWATRAFCQLNRIPHDAALLIKQYPPPYDVVSLQQALQGFGLNNGLKQYTIAQLPNASLPCLAILKPAPPPTKQATQPPLTDELNSDSPSSNTANTAISNQETANPDTTTLNAPIVTYPRI